jgi:hypothetical protein
MVVGQFVLLDLQPNQLPANLGRFYRLQLSYQSPGT